MTITDIRETPFSRARIRGALLLVAQTNNARAKATGRELTEREEGFDAGVRFTLGGLALHFELISPPEDIGKKNAKVDRALLPFIDV